MAKKLKEPEPIFQPEKSVTFYAYEGDIGTQESFKHAIHGGNLHSVIWDLMQWFRSKIKYAGDDVHEKSIEALEEAREQLFSLLRDEQVDSLF